VGGPSGPSGTTNAGGRGHPGGNTKASITRLARWLAVTSKHKSFEASRIVLVYDGGSGPSDDVDVAEWSARELGVSVEDAAGEIIIIAQSDCDSRQTLCRYAVQYRYRPREDEPTELTNSTHPLRLTPTTLDAGAPIIAESPDARGLVGQLMRHIELKEAASNRLMTAVVGVVETLARTQQSMMESMGSRLAVAEQARAEEEAAAIEALKAAEVDIDDADVARQVDEILTRLESSPLVAVALKKMLGSGE
jgi:hypothetical protein